MRRIVIVVILVAAFAVAGYMLLRPKGGGRVTKAKTAVADSTSGSDGTFGKTVAARSTAKRTVGRTAGTLKPMTKEERKAQVKKLRVEERRRKKELKRQEREKRKMLKYARTLRGKRRTSRSKGVYYTVKAIVSLGSERYALVDSRRVEVGDVVMGRRIVAIEPDRVEVEAFGRRSAVRVGESLMPAGYSAKKLR